MNDRAIHLFDQYDIEVVSTRKARGAFICQTPDQLYIFKEYSGNNDRLVFQNRVLEAVRENSGLWAEQILPNKEEGLFVQDMDGCKYILKTYREGRELNIASKEECVSAVKLLAKLHEGFFVKKLPEEVIAPYSPQKEYEKKNKELKRVRRYLKEKSQKTWFELFLQKNYDYFLNQAYEITDQWKPYERQLESSPLKDTFSCCHGDFQYHNILFDGSEWFVVNYEKCMADHPTRDLVLFLRKLLEKSDWSVDLGKELIEGYRSEHQLTEIEQKDLFYHLAYPEKFWKIVNFYYNSGKSWIPGKNAEKLEKLLIQEQNKKQFLEEVFQNSWIGETKEGKIIL